MEAVNKHIINSEIIKELSRREFFFYCKTMYPNFYKDDRKYIEEVCNDFEDFYKSNDDVLIVNMPPR